MNKFTVFIADDDLALVNTLSMRCKAKGYRVQTATDASSAWQRIDRCRPDMILLDVDMPCGNGLSVMEMIRTHQDLSKTPVILLTGRTDEEVQRRCLENDSYYVPKGGAIWDRVEPILQEHLQAEAIAQPSSLSSEVACTGGTEGPLSLLDAVFAAIGVDDESLWSDAPKVNAAADQDSTPWVLSVDDDKAFAEGLMLRLLHEGVGFRRAFNGEDGCRKATTMTANAILLDYEMPQGNGAEVLRRLKEDPRTRSIPVFVLTGRKDAAIENKMLNLGAEAFFTKPYDWPTLWAALKPHLPAADKSKLSSTGAVELSAVAPA